MAASSVRPCQCLLRLAWQQQATSTPIRITYTTVRSLRQQSAGSRKQTKLARAMQAQLLDGAAIKEEEDEKDPHMDGIMQEFTSIAGVDKFDQLLPPEAEQEEPPRPEKPNGFFAMGEETDDPGEDDEFEPDDITSNAHAELEQVRELRELERVISWDMPLLHQHIQPFTPPTAAQPLRWKYTTFLGEEHPAARKVVLDFKPAALPDLTQPQLHKFLKLLGARYNHTTGIAKMSSDHYPTAPQNKRHIGELLARVLAEARDQTDTFDDIPLDTRHVRVKDKTRHLRFPDAWKMTDDRVAALAAARADRLLNAPVVHDGRALAASGSVVEEDFVAVRPRRRRG